MRTLWIGVRTMKWPVEICVTIAVLGLAILVVRGCPRHLEHPRKVVAIVEIDQLDTAFNEYAKQFGFPPSFSDVDRDTRKSRFMNHVAKASLWRSAYGNSAKDFDVLNEKIHKGFGDGKPGYNWRDPSTGKLMPLDLNRLDQAEAIVFWLSGFPTPVDPQSGNPIANRRVFGFHREDADLLRRDSSNVERTDPLRYRTSPCHQFDEYRLTDHDRDGWLEYAPKTHFEKELAPPYVYFDAEAYVATSHSPDQLGLIRYPVDELLRTRWGYIAPFAARFVPATTIVEWHNPDSFQIICAGLDNQYSDSESVQRRVVELPSALAHTLPNREEGVVSIEEQDNLTNLFADTIETTRQEYRRYLP